MATRSQFAKEIAKLTLTHEERAIAMLWFYRETQAFDERSVSELAADLHEEGFPKPNVTRLASSLRRAKFTVVGKRKGTLQLDARRIDELYRRYHKLLNIPEVDVRGDFLPPEWTASTRKYLEQLVKQINGTYEIGFYDACATLCRRLMESLIIECYIRAGRTQDIQRGGSFFALDALISFASADKTMTFSRNSPKTMRDVKTVGDTAAHDRTYITPKIDLDELKLRYRHLIQELLAKAGISTTP